MKLYGNLSSLNDGQFNTLLDFFYPECNKVSIYFPNDAEVAVINFKERFLEAIDLCEIDDEPSILEPKEGFSMVIAALSDNVKELLKEIHPSFHLSFGIIQEEALVLFVGEEGELAIDSEQPDMTAHPLFKTFTQA